MTLNEISVRPIESHEIERYDELMQTHHYLGAARPIGESLRYVALWYHQWVALLGFSSAALKCAPRDQWIGWSYHHQFDRLHLLTNNSRFLILPQCIIPIWHPGCCQCANGSLLLETFVDPGLIRSTSIDEWEIAISPFLVQTHLCLIQYWTNPSHDQIRSQGQRHR